MWVRMRERASGMHWEGLSAIDCVYTLPPSWSPVVCVCRMSSVRRSSIFDRLQLKTVTLTKSQSGYGLELQGSSPPVIAQVCECITFWLVCVCVYLSKHAPPPPSIMPYTNSLFSLQLERQLSDHMFVKEIDYLRLMMWMYGGLAIRRLVSWLLLVLTKSVSCCKLASPDLFHVAALCTVAGWARREAQESHLATGAVDGLSLEMTALSITTAILRYIYIEYYYYILHYIISILPTAVGIIYVIILHKGHRGSWCYCSKKLHSLQGSSWQESLCLQTSKGRLTYLLPVCWHWTRND